MPWKESTAVEERKQFIQEWQLLGGRSCKQDWAGESACPTWATGFQTSRRAVMQSTLVARQAGM
jgi:hypothetical protein